MSLSEILEKINSTPVQKGQKVATLWCRSIASGAIDLNQPIPDNVWMWRIPPQKAADEGVEIELEIINRESKHSLFAPEVRSIKSASFDQRWCAHAAKIRGLPCEILAGRQQNISNGVVS